MDWLLFQNMDFWCIGSGVWLNLCILGVQTREIKIVPVARRVPIYQFFTSCIMLLLTVLPPTSKGQMINSRS